MEKTTKVVWNGCVYIAGYVIHIRAILYDLLSSFKASVCLETIAKVLTKPLFRE